MSSAAIESRKPLASVLPPAAASRPGDWLISSQPAEPPLKYEQRAGCVIGKRGNTVVFCTTLPNDAEGKPMRVGLLYRAKFLRHIEREGHEPILPGTVGQVRVEKTGAVVLVFRGVVVMTDARADCDYQVLK